MVLPEWVDANPSSGARLYMLVARKGLRRGFDPLSLSARHSYTSTVTTYIYHRGVGTPARVGMGNVTGYGMQRRGDYMQNFIYSVPTTVFFGKGQLKHLGCAARGFGSAVLLVYGGGSIKRTGLYKAVLGQLEGLCVYEVSGVQPNPRIDSVREGVKLCREQHIDMVLAVGGGSVIDCAKAIAAGAAYEGDPWDLILDSRKIKEVLPILTVLTIAATGSEMNPYAVISNPETNEKLDMGNRAMRPSVTIMDPEYTFSVSQRQTAAGTADIISHIFEVYFNHVPGAFVQASMAEALLKTCFKYGKLACDQPDNYEARANLMWASSLAINGLLSLGCDVGWSTHPMEHELSAFYDITHGVGLAILIPPWMEYVLNEDTVDRFAQYGVNVWGIDSGLDRFDIARKAIQATRSYFVNDLHLPTRLSEVGIGEGKLELMAERAAGAIEDAFYPLNREDVLNIYRACL